MKGGTMRLGAYDCQITKDTLAYRIYGSKLISERHRHRYEFNARYADDFSKAGLVTSGHNPQTGLTEIVELPASEHPFFIGVQFHPEYKSTPENPHPLFRSFIEAAMK
jgi:CTP synthase